jgi:hypothetical protein
MQEHGKFILVTRDAGFRAWVDVVSRNRVVPVEDVVVSLATSFIACENRLRINICIHLPDQIDKLHRSIVLIAERFNVASHPDKTHCVLLTFNTAMRTLLPPHCCWRCQVIHLPGAGCT